MNPQVLLPWGSLIAAALPRTWAESLAGAAAAVAAPWLGGARHLSRLNLEAALEGTVSKETCARVTFHYALYYLAIMRLAHRTTDAAVGRVRARGMEHVTQTLERGRGCVALGAHVGNWDVSAIAMAQHFGRLHAFAEPLRHRCCASTVARAHGTVCACCSPATRDACRLTYCGPTRFSAFWWIVHSDRDTHGRALVAAGCRCRAAPSAWRYAAARACTPCLH